MGLPNIVGIVGAITITVGMLISECALASGNSTLNMDTLLYMTFLGTLGFKLFKGNLFHENIMKVLGAAIGIPVTLALFFFGVNHAQWGSASSHGSAAGLFVALIGTGIVGFASLF